MRLLTGMQTDETVLILRGVLSLARRMRAARPSGSASLSAISILATLHKSGPMPAVRLAAEEQLQPQSLTRLIAALERDGLIARTQSATDRREMLIEPTPRGLKTLVEDMQIRRRWLKRAMDDALNAGERARLLKAAEAMLKLAGHDEAAAVPVRAQQGGRS